MWQARSAQKRETAIQKIPPAVPMRHAGEPDFLTAAARELSLHGFYLATGVVKDLEAQRQQLSNQAPRAEYSKSCLERVET